MKTKFEKWARKFGVRRIVAQMNALGPEYQITASAVYQWIYGEVAPRAQKIDGLVKIAGRSITYRDIHDHIKIAREQRANREQQAVPAALTNEA